MSAPIPSHRVSDAYHRVDRPQASMHVEFHHEGVPLALDLRLLDCELVDFPETRIYEHPQPSFARLWTLRRGAAVVAWPGGQEEIRVGDVLLIPELATFTCRYRAGSRLLSVHLHLHDLGGRSAFRILDRPRRQRTPTLARRLHSGRESAVDWSALCTVTVVLGQLMEDTWPQLAAEARRAEPFRELFAYLAQRPIATVTVAELAAQLGVSAGSLGRRFQRALGLSLKRFLVQEQIRQAQTLLTHSDAPVAAIAERLGHGDERYFYRLFKRACGMTPMQYRAAPLGEGKRMSARPSSS